MSSKKSRDSSVVGNIISGFLSTVIEGLLENVFDVAKKGASDVARHVSRIMLFTLSLFTAAVFAIIGTISLLQEYFDLSHGWYYILAAALLLFWALVTKIQIEKER